MRRSWGPFYHPESQIRADLLIQLHILRTLSPSMCPQEPPGTLASQIPRHFRPGANPLALRAPLQLKGSCLRLICVLLRG